MFVRRISSRRRLRARLALAVLVAWLPSLVACDPATSEITVADAFVPVPATAESAAAYLTIRNSGDLDDELVGVSTPSAPMAHLHESTVDAEGRSKMVAVGALKIPANSTVALRPAGLHLMLMQPAPLAAGERVELTLRFRHAGAKRVEAKVVDDISEVIGE